MTKSAGLVRELLAEADDAGNGTLARCSGAGIVVCAGGSVMLTNAYVLVRVLRDIHNSVLPIQIWHLGPAEMPEFLARTFEKMGCTIVDALSVGSGERARIHDGWQLKAFALKHSSFEHVIMLDADQVPLRDPEALLEWPEYQETGAVFWPDVVDIAAENPVWQMLGLQPCQVRSWESGQMCVNKKMHGRAVNLVLAINERAETFYRFVYGDKDTFLLAWKMTDSGFALVPYLPFQGDRYLVQRDFSGNPFFQHHTNCKWSLTRPNEEQEGMKLYSECQGFLEELAKSWNGHVFQAPLQSIQTQLVEGKLIAQHRFLLTRGDNQALEVELLAGHQIGKGRAYDLTNWYVEQPDSEPVLVLQDRHKVRAKLSMIQPGRWQGDSVDRLKEEFHLEPLPVAAENDALPEAPIELVAGLVRAAGGDLRALDCTLELMARTHPEIVNQIAIAAASLESQNAGLATHLSMLAAKLAKAGESQADPVRHFTLDDQKLYVRP